ncbi:MAG: hypothetical protein GOU97_01245 [Nanoarchaeota archaeon]|nr:hypothetical protein [Nanoarchaeota archaeon]
MAYVSGKDVKRFRDGLEIVLEDSQTRISHVNELRLIFDEKAQSQVDLSDKVMTESDFAFDRKCRENRIKNYLSRQGVMGVSATRIMKDNDGNFFLSLDCFYDNTENVWYAKLEENVLKIFKL